MGFEFATCPGSRTSKAWKDIDGLDLLLGYSHHAALRAQKIENRFSNKPLHPLRAGLLKNGEISYRHELIQNPSLTTPLPVSRRSNDDVSYRQFF